MNIRIIFILSLLMTIFQTGNAQPEDRYVQGTLSVKMKDDMGYKVEGKQLVSVKDNLKMQGLLEQLSVLGWWSREYQVSDVQLQQWRMTASRNLRQVLPDPSAAFRFQVQDPRQLSEALILLQQLPDLEEVLRVPIPYKAPVPDFAGQQLYKGSAAPGINADSVWLVYNNKGAGIKLCDIEYGFNATHTDFPAIPILGNTPVDPFSGGGIDHGTAVFGVVVAKDNGWGTTGIAPDCSPYFAGAFTSQNNYNLNIAMTSAMTTLGAGDVLLLEQQIGGPNVDTVNPASQVGLVPVEWFKPYYNTIKLAVGQGITVVEAAGNGQQNLDDTVYSTGNGGHHPFLAANNSGAIIVGAGGAGAGEPARARLWFSNYGSRVDLQGNGEAVTTTGYGDLYNAEGNDNQYTQQFGGTSSASPIVSGAVILLQSVFKSERGGATLSPAQVRDVLKATAKAQTAGSYPVAGYPVGPLPDVYKAIQEALSSITSIEETNNSASSLRLYPNPSSGVFFLSFGPAWQSKKVQVCNSAGTIIREYTATPDRVVTVDLNDQPDGIYWLRAVSGQNAVVKKIVVAR